MPHRRGLRNLEGRWKTRLFTSHNTYTEVTRTHRIAAERLAQEHSDRLTPETFFTELATRKPKAGRQR